MAIQRVKINTGSAGNVMTPFSRLDGLCHNDRSKRAYGVRMNSDYLPGAAAGWQNIPMAVAIDDYSSVTDYANLSAGAARIIKSGYYYIEGFWYVSDRTNNVAACVELTKNGAQLVQDITRLYHGNSPCMGTAIQTLVHLDANDVIRLRYILAEAAYQIRVSQWSSLIITPYAFDEEVV